MVVADGCGGSAGCGDNPLTPQESKEIQAISDTNNEAQRLARHTAAEPPPDQADQGCNDTFTCILQTAQIMTAPVADALTGGATRETREMLGQDYVDEDTRAYGNVHATTNVLSIILPGPKFARGLRYLDEVGKYGDDVAQSSTSGIKLARSLASRQQMGEVGTIIAGRGSSTPLKVADDLAARYGGAADEWIKRVSSTYRGPDGYQFQTRWYENVVTGLRYEMKTKLAGWKI